MELQLLWLVIYLIRRIPGLERECLGNFFWVDKKYLIFFRYIFGLVLVCVCYIFIFQSCLFCDWFHCDAQGLKMFYYILFPSLFNVGWASLQIAHMSLVPSLSSSRLRRDRLNGLRNTFTYGANFTVLLMALILFIVIE